MLSRRAMKTIAALNDSAGIHRYLSAHGWEVSEQPHDGVFVYAFEGKQVTVVSKRFKDFARRTAEVVVTLAEIHDLYVSDVLEGFASELHR